MKSIARGIAAGLLVSTALFSCIAVSHAQTPTAVLEAPAGYRISVERLGRLLAQLQRYVDEGKLAGAGRPG